ncbi:MAG: carboxylating nicotinate-nucleotide diphosphorylase, partial [Candidatus Eremiobacteraeota bacterium]|nr:carboxylating nicotinate-nucleotide diphosphorylase [Candidatus Eremiobacteraeota bacterium]
MSELHRLLIEPVVRAGLLEDLSHGGDLTTDAIVPAAARATANFVTRDPGVVAGLACAQLAFELLDPSARFTIAKHDSELVAAGTTIATVEASARAVLTGERTALNLLCRLSGIATATRTFADAIAHTRARVVDTRKTIPGLRALQKYAVRCGGGGNHRFGLDDAVLIKDNHVALAGSVTEAVRRARASVAHLVKIELEVDSLDQLREALDLPIDAVLLDNMSPEQLREAVALVGGRFLTEASGRVDA